MIGNNWKDDGMIGCAHPPRHDPCSRSYTPVQLRTLRVHTLALSADSYRMHVSAEGRDQGWHLDGTDSHGP